jgi:hypothetical protein
VDVKCVYVFMCYRGCEVCLCLCAIGGCEVYLCVYVLYGDVKCDYVP